MHLTAQQVHDALPWATLDRALSAAFAVGATVPLRHVHPLSASDTLLLMPAWNDGAIGVKTVTVIPAAHHLGAPTVGSTYLLLDRATGATRATMDGDALTVRRTAAVSAIAARLMARADARVMTMIGTGHLAPWMVRAHCALRPALQRVQLWGRNTARANAMAAALAGEGLPVVPVTDVEDAVRHAHIVCCATTATAPVVHGAWLAEGTHVDVVGGFTPHMREVDDAAVSISRIAVDTGAGVLSEAGDLVGPLQRGIISRDHIVAELADLVRGDVAGRTHPAQITLFKSVGTALADLAAAQVVWEALVAD